MLALMLACNAPFHLDSDEPDVTDDTPSTSDTDLVPIPLDPAYLSFFDPISVQEIALEIAPEELARLEVAPRDYVHGAFVHGETRLADVGIRLKGSSTFHDMSGKAAFKIRFNAFESGAEYAGLERLTLNNLTNDAAQCREVLAYRLWNDAGVPAPMATFARVVVNGEYFGLYAAVEPMDDAWLRKRYREPDGNLWEANDSADLTVSGLPHFELAVAAVGVEVASLEDVAARLAEAVADTEDVATDVIEGDSFLDYWAWSMATGNLDGYPYNLNDYYMYADPEAGGRLRFSPWGLDETWDTGWFFQWGVGVVARDCATNRDCLSALLLRTEGALRTYEEADPVARLEELYALTETAMQEDPRRPWTPAEVLAARARLSVLVGAWPARVRASIAAAE